MALLYLLACTLLPSFLAGGMPAPSMTMPRHHRVAFSAVGVFDASGIAAASAGHRSVAALLQNRRMALESPDTRRLNRARFAASRHQPSLLFSDIDNLENNEKISNGNLDVQVDYKEAGMKVSLLQALNASYWNEYPIYENGKLK
jgi:hypothetical protein